jgi:AbrB family looped-hinge helix DNA binding protein
MTSKGQITVPKEVRDDLHLEAGSQVMFVKLPNGRYTILARTGSVADLAGMLHYPGMPHLTIEEMNDAIAGAAAESVMESFTR